jgi:hypothetical protein
MSTKASSWVRRAALVAGFALGLGYVALHGVPAGSQVLQARVSVITARAADLVASPSGPIVRASPLRAGRAARIRGAVTLRNPTDVALFVEPRSTRRAGDLDLPLQIRIVAGGQTLFDGGLEALHAGAAASFTIGAGKRQRVLVEVWLPSSAREYESRAADVAIEWRTRVGR